MTKQLNFIYKYIHCINHHDQNIVQFTTQSTLGQESIVCQENSIWIYQDNMILLSIIQIFKIFSPKNEIRRFWIWIWNFKHDVIQKKNANKVTMLFHHNESHLLKAKVVKMVFWPYSSLVRFCWVIQISLPNCSFKGV